MGRKRTPGLRVRNGVWHINGKVVCGRTLFESTGESDLAKAEQYLARRVEEIRQASIYGVRPRRTFREAAAKYLEEHTHLRSIADAAWHLRLLDPYIGSLPLNQIHDGTLGKFVEVRRRAGVKAKSINLSLEIVRRVLNLCARKWRDDNGLTWLETAPLLSMLPVKDAAKPFTLSWENQHKLFKLLPAHLEVMALFKVNAGCREKEVCGLRWDWEVKAPSLGRSVFVIPGEHTKNGEDRLVVLNDVAWSVINAQRGKHAVWVFPYNKRKPVARMHNSAWKKAWREAGFPTTSEYRRGVHNLRHTFGRRLRAAGVPLETRKVLLGHRNGDITTHYSEPELRELLDAVNSITELESGKNRALTLLEIRSA